MIIDLQKNPFGLGGGIYMSGSITSPEGHYFCYCPIQPSCNINLKTTNITNGSSISGIYSIPIFASITCVTQSSGEGILYYALKDNLDQ